MDVAIIGAGATGLTAALEVVKQGHKPHIFDRHFSPGGMARVCRSEKEDLEIFYHHIFTSDTAVVELIKEMGLEKKLLWLPPKNGLYAKGKLHPFTSPFDLLMFPELSFVDRLKMGLFVLRAQKRQHWKDLENLTAQEWIVQELGKSIYEICWQPLLESKFGSSAPEVSAVWLWNKIKLRSSSRVRGQRKELLGYLEGSFGFLYETIKTKLVHEGAQIALGTSVTEIAPQEDGRLVLTTPGGKSMPFEKTLYTGSPRELGSLCPGLSVQEKQGYESIISMANLCLLVELDAPLSPYYWISVADKGLPFVAVIEQTNLLPRERYGSNVVYLSRYISAKDPFFNAPEEEIRTTFLKGLQQVFPSWNPREIRNSRLFRGTDTQPLVDRNYLAKIPSHTTSVPGLYLVCMDQIFPEDRGQNYAVAMGRQALKILGIEGKAP